MKYDYNNMDELLRSGAATPDELAHAFTDELNAALHKWQGEQAWDAALINLEEAWNNAIDVYFDIFATDDGITASDCHFNTEDLDRLIKDSVKTANHVCKVKSALTDVVDKVKTDGGKSFEDVMSNFFESLGI